MNRFLGSLLLFGTGFLVLFLACSGHFAVLSRNDNLDVQLQLFSHVRPEVLILGDSHSAMDLDGRTLGPRYFSFAYPQENWREILLKARYAFDAKPEIRMVVIPVDWHMFAAYRNENEDLTHTMRYDRSYEHLSEAYDGRLFPVRYVRALSTLYLPLTLGANWTNYRVLVLDDLSKTLLGEAKRKQIEIDSYGSISYSDTNQFALLPADSRREAARTRAQEQLRDPIVCAPLVNAFDSFLDLCSSRGIQVVGIRYPLTREFREAAELYDLARVDRIYRDRSGRFLRTLDYRTLFDEQPEAFRDEDHLTKRAACEFTKRVREDLETIAPERPESRPAPSEGRVTVAR